MLILFKCVLISVILVFLTGCTIELKATDLEASGHMTGVYKFENIHFTERDPLWPSSNSAAALSTLAAR